MAKFEPPYIRYSSEYVIKGEISAPRCAEHYGAFLYNLSLFIESKALKKVLEKLAIASYWDLKNNKYKIDDPGDVRIKIEQSDDDFTLLQKAAPFIADRKNLDQIITFEKGRIAKDRYQASRSEARRLAR